MVTTFKPVTGSTSPVQSLSPPIEVGDPYELDSDMTIPFAAQISLLVGELIHVDGLPGIVKGDIHPSTHDVLKA